MQGENTLEKLSKKLDSDLVIEELAEPEYLLQLSGKVAKWQSLFSKKIGQRKKLDTRKDIKFKELYMFYQFEFNVKLDKKELNTFINADSEYIQIREELDEIDTQIDFIEKAIKTLESQSWNLKTRLEYMKVLGLVDY